MATPAALDRFDLAILDILQADNTTPQRAIAQAVNLSAPAVQRRIQRLKDSGVIRANVAVLDPVKVGKPLTIVLEVHLGDLFKVFSGIALECYRDEWKLGVRRMGSRPCEQPGRQSSEFIGPVSPQPSRARDLRNSNKTLNRFLQPLAPVRPVTTTNPWRRP